MDRVKPSQTQPVVLVIGGLVVLLVGLLFVLLTGAWIDELVTGDSRCFLIVCSVRSLVWRVVAGSALLGGVIWAVVSTRRERRIFEDAAVYTVCGVDRRTVQEVTSEDGRRFHRYCLIVSFVNQAGSRTQLKAIVSKKYYNSTSEGASVIIRYVPSSPRTALLQGE